MSIRSWKWLNMATLEKETTARGLGDTLRGLQEENTQIMLTLMNARGD